MIRRHFLQSILALGVAPAIVRADSLMRIVPRDVGLYGPTTWRRGCIATAVYDLVEHISGGIGGPTVYTYTAPLIQLAHFGTPGIVRGIMADGRPLPLDVAHFDDRGGFVLRDLDLTDFGNRIPQFEIEIEGPA